MLMQPPATGGNATKTNIKGERPLETKSARCERNMEIVEEGSSSHHPVRFKQPPNGPFRMRFNPVVGRPENLSEEVFELCSQGTTGKGGSAQENIKGVTEALEERSQADSEHARKPVYRLCGRVARTACPDRRFVRVSA